jgi:hypothetical protein
VAAFERIFGAAMLSSTESTRSMATAIPRSRLCFLEEAEIWHYRSGEAPFGQNIITRSDEVYAGISGDPIPADLETIEIPAAAPALLDLFMWRSTDA